MIVKANCDSDGVPCQHHLVPALQGYPACLGGSGSFCTPVGSFAGGEAGFDCPDKPEAKATQRKNENHLLLYVKALALVGTGCFRSDLSRDY